MKHTNILHLVLATALSAAAPAVFAGELDQSPVPANLPKSIVVQVNNETGESTVFKSDAKDITTEEAAKAAAATLKDGETITAVAIGELDKGGAQESWGFRGNRYGGYGNYRGGWGGGYYGGYRGGYGGGYGGYYGNYYGRGYANYNSYYSYYNYGSYYNYNPCYAYYGGASSFYFYGSVY